MAVSPRGEVAVIGEGPRELDLGDGPIRGLPGTFVGVFDRDGGLLSTSILWAFSAKALIAGWGMSVAFSPANDLFAAGWSNGVLGLRDRQVGTRGPDLYVVRRPVLP